MHFVVDESLENFSVTKHFWFLLNMHLLITYHLQDTVTGGEKGKDITIGVNT